MPERIIILSGKVGSGKTTLADQLAATFNLDRLKTRTFLGERAVGVPAERGALQDFGERLDKRTRGSWVREDLQRAVEALPSDAVVIVDAVRIPGQVNSIRKAYGRLVLHVHLEASDKELAKRYRNRVSHEIKELPSYAAVQRNKTERNVPKLAKVADVVIRTDRGTPQTFLSVLQAI